MWLLAWLPTVLLVAGLICFIQAARGVHSRFNLQSAGLACWVLSILVERALT